MINPYTETGTFGVSWNGGVRPDFSLNYIQPFDNEIEDEEPMGPIPSNMYLKTQEARRSNILEGGIPKRIYEGRQCEEKSPIPIIQEDEIDIEIEKEEEFEEIDHKIVGGIILLLVLFFIVKSMH